MLLYRPKQKISTTASEEVKFPASSIDGLATVATSGSYNDLTDKPEAPGVPDIVQTTGTSTTAVMSQKAVTDELNTKANSADLAQVATSGNYNDLSNKPTIPAAANNGTLTIQKNGTDIATFGANQSGNATANITVPTKVSELTNDSGYTTNEGTVTSVAVKMNGSEKGKVTSSGTIDLGTVLTDASKFATSAQGTKADNAMPKSGGTFTGDVTIASEHHLKTDLIKSADDSKRIAEITEAGLEIGGSSTPLRFYSSTRPVHANVNKELAYTSDIPTDYVPNTRKVNNKELSSDIALGPSDVGALPTAGGTITGNLTVGGNLTINGTTTTVDSTTLQVKDKLIEVAHGNTATLTTPAGLVAPKYDGTNSGALVFDSTGTAYVGDVTLKDGNIDVANSGLQPLATRTGLVGGNLVQYDSSALTLKDSGKKISDLALKTDIPTNYVTTDTDQDIKGKKTVVSPSNKDNSNQIATTAWAGRRYKSIADFGFTSQTTVKAIVQKIIDNWYEYCTFACTNDNFNNFSDTPDGYGTLIIEVGSNALRPFISFTKQIGDSNSYKYWQANIVRGENNQVTEIQWYEIINSNLPQTISGAKTFVSNIYISQTSGQNAGITWQSASDNTNRGIFRHYDDGTTETFVTQSGGFLFRPLNNNNTKSIKVDPAVGALYPEKNSGADLGKTAQRWNAIYAGNTGVRSTGNIICDSKVISYSAVESNKEVPDFNGILKDDLYTTAPTKTRGAQYLARDTNGAYIGGLRIYHNTNGTIQSQLLCRSQNTDVQNYVYFQTQPDATSNANKDKFAFIPHTNGNIDLGLSNNKWNNAYIQTVHTSQILSSEDSKEYIACRSSGVEIGYNDRPLRLYANSRPITAGSKIMVASDFVLSGTTLTITLP